MDNVRMVAEIIGYVFIIAVMLKARAWMRTGFWQWVERLKAKREARRVESLVTEHRESERKLEAFYKEQAANEGAKRP